MTIPQQPRPNPRPHPCLYLLLGSLIGLCLFLTLTISIATWWLWNQQPQTIADTLPPTATFTPTPPPTATPTHPATPTQTPSPTPEPHFNLTVPNGINQTTSPHTAEQTLQTLLQTNFPVQDYHQTYYRYSGLNPSPRTLTLPRATTGQTATFSVDGETITATLAIQTKHASFWFDQRLTYDTAVLQRVASRFNDELYPLTTSYFGTEWSPGIDGDPRLNILHVNGFPGDELGFFSSADTYPQAIFTDSNQREIIYLNLQRLDLEEELYYGTLVHELQHLVQWHADGNEPVWLDEGLAQLAEYIAGFDSFDVNDYTDNPNIPLNQWANNDGDNVYAHYGASALFTVYLWEQLGDEAIRELAQHPADGFAAIQDILQRHRPQQTLTQFMGDWYAANYRGPAAYNRLTFRAPRPDATITTFPYEEQETLQPFGVRYLTIDQPGTYTLTFAGDATAPLLTAATQPSSGDYVWYALGRDDVSATLTHAFDLTAVSTAQLEFHTWYDLEEDYDYAYLFASTDNGQTWEPLPLPNGARGEFGSAFNGRSDDIANKGGWLPQTISLDDFAGQTILLRFDVLTDSGIHQRGFALDDFHIRAIGYASDLEQDGGGWQASGFARVGVMAPQNWSLQLLTEDPTGKTAVIPLDPSLDPLNQLQYQLDIPANGTLIIAPVTPLVEDTAVYWLKIE